MKEKAHYSQYDEETTARCERALVTLLGDLGPWGKRIFLAGGLAPRYLVGRLAEGAKAHVGTTDIDLVIGIALGDETPETYRMLHNNLVKAGFDQEEPGFRWSRKVEGVSVILEFLCETDQVAPGEIFRPKEGTGAKVSAFNVRGALLGRDDFIEVPIEAERLDEGGQSDVVVQVVNLLPYTVLKIFAFQQRHANKDAYDLVFTLLNHQEGPRAAGRKARGSVVADSPHATEALALLEERFKDVEQDGSFRTRNSWAMMTTNERSYDKRL